MIQDQNKRRSCLRKELNFTDFVNFKLQLRSWTIQLMMSRMMIVLMKIYISPIEILYHYSRNLINGFFIYRLFVSINNHNSRKEEEQQK
jgi:hypothetical protein